MSPCLRVLNHIPFAIPFKTRFAIFRDFVINDMVSRKVDRHGSGRTPVCVRRGNISQDAFKQLAKVDMKAPIDITITDQLGQKE